MNNIAVFLDSSNRTIAFNKAGTIKVFVKKEKGWEITQEVKLSLNEAMGLKEVRERLQQAAKQIKDCDIMVGEKVYGLSYNIFEALQFNIWEFEGEPETFLDYILEKEEINEREEQEQKEAEEQEQKGVYVKQIGNDHYSINLKEMQSSKRSISSKQAIIPFLKQGRFKQLDIICSHIPPWIENEAVKYHLKIDAEKFEADFYKIKLAYI